MKKLFLLLPLLLLTSCGGYDKKQVALNNCIYDIYKQLDYQFAYTYQDIYGADEGAYCFDIRAFGEEEITYWFCYVSFNDNYVDCDMYKNELIECEDYKYQFTFKVKEHYTAYLTSEVQETTHDPYLAYCKSGVNECFIEVPYGDTREELSLVHTGYIITYELEVDGKDYTVSNNGWALYEHKV